MELQEQDGYDVAFLSGGRARVLDVALVELVETGRVRVQRSGYLSVVVDTATGPVERAVLDLLLARRARTWQELGATVDAQVCDDLARRLALSGLLAATPGSRLRGALDRGRALGRWAVTPAGRDLRSRPAPVDPPGRSRYAVARGGVAAVTDPVLRDALLGRFVQRRPCGRGGREGSWAWGGAEAISSDGGRHGHGGGHGCGGGGGGHGCGGGSSCGGGGGCGGGGCGGG